MSQNQKDEQVITNNQRDQQNPGSQSNQNHQKNETDKTAKVPEMNDKDTSEIPEKLHVKEHEQDFNKPSFIDDQLKEEKDESVEKNTSSEPENIETINKTENQSVKNSVE
jgi:hypothetical protein